MSKLRLILTYILLPLEMAGGSIKTPAQTPTPASRQDCSPASCHPARSVLKGPHATVYLFGSVHLLAKDREWRTPVLNTAPASSQTLRLEVTGAEDPKVAQAIVMELGIDASHPLSTKLSNDQLAKLDSEAKTFNMSEAMMEPMRPWLAAVTLDVAPAGSWHRPQQRRRIDLDRRIQEEQSHGAGLRDRLAAIPLLRRPARKDWTCLNLSINDFAKQPEQSKQLVEAWYRATRMSLIAW